MSVQSCERTAPGPNNKDSLPRSPTTSWLVHKPMPCGHVHKRRSFVQLDWTSVGVMLPLECFSAQASSHILNSSYVVAKVVMVAASKNEGDLYNVTIAFLQFDIL